MPTVERWRGRFRKECRYEGSWVGWIASYVYGDRPFDWKSQGMFRGPTVLLWELWSQWDAAVFKSSANADESIVRIAFSYSDLCYGSSWKMFFNHSKALIVTYEIRYVFEVLRYMIITFCYGHVKCNTGLTEGREQKWIPTVHFLCWIFGSYKSLSFREDMNYFMVCFAIGRLDAVTLDLPVSRMNGVVAWCSEGTAKQINWFSIGFILLIDGSVSSPAGRGSAGKIEVMMWTVFLQKR